jgi:hypothetical protein
VAIKLGELLPDPEGILVKLLDWLSSSENNTLGEDALMAISALVLSGKWKMIPFGKRIYGKVVNAIESGGSTLVRIGLCTLGDLFHALQSPDLNDMADDALDLVFGFLNRSSWNEISDVLPAVTKALAMIVGAAGSKISQTKRGDIARLMRQLQKSQKDMLEVNDSYRVVFAVVRTYTNLFKGFSDDKDWLMEVARDVFGYIDAIWKNKWFNDGILMELFCLFHVVGETLQQAVNVKLNSRIVKNLIAAGRESQDPKLKSAADVIGEFLSDL